MQYRSVATFALAALATTATAQQSRVFTRASQSVREADIFGRQTDGYQPEDEICGGEGSTCAEACGGGYLECNSTDESVHCYNPDQEESCCGSGNGSSCLASFFCARDTDTETFCCPEGASLEQCAKDFGVTGALVSDAPAPLPESTSSSLAPEPTPEPISSSIEVVVVASSSFDISSAVSSAISSILANSTSTFESSAVSTATTTLTTETEAAATESSASDGAEEEEDDDESSALTHGPAMALAVAVAMLATMF